MTTRRAFLGLAAGASVAAFRDDGLGRVLAAGRGAEAQPADIVARDESYWREIQKAFTVNRSYINLQTGPAGLSRIQRGAHSTPSGRTFHSLLVSGRQV